jgi:DNA polymerase elongation subunit (family B)
MNLNNILFLDIETVSQKETYQQLSEEWKNMWDHKALQREIKDPLMHTPESVYPRASIYAEFGKVICISCGYLLGEGEERKLVLKSFYADDEKELLSQFADSIRKWERNKTGQIDLGAKSLCAHNGKEFDFPYLCRRMVINGVSLPEAFKISGRKPWDIKHLLDTLELWKFGDNKNFITLKLMAAIFNVTSPKDDIDGSMVYSVYWKDKNLMRIVEYCQKDVITLAQILLAFYCQPLVNPENIAVKNEY